LHLVNAACSVAKLVEIVWGAISGLAGLVATVPVEKVAVVTLLNTRLDIPIPADGNEALVRACVCIAGVAIVTLLQSQVDIPIPADRTKALICARVVIARVAVVTLFASLDNTVAANRCSTLLAGAGNAKFSRRAKVPTSTAVVLIFLQVAAYARAAREPRLAGQFTGAAVAYLT